MLKRDNKEQVCCPVVFYEEISVVFGFKKSQLGNEIGKKFSNFQSFFEVFVKSMTDLVDWNA